MGRRPRGRRSGTALPRVHILFALVRDRCRELGCVEGADLTCTHSDPRTVGFVVDDGSPARLEREYAWFVQVEGVGPADGR